MKNAGRLVSLCARAARYSGRSVDGRVDSPIAFRRRRARRHARRWLETHGLTIVLVSGMMVVAWLIAAH